MASQEEHLDRESLRVRLAQGESVERIAKRFRRHPSTVSYWMAKYGLQAAGRDKHGPRGEIDRAWLVESVPGARGRRMLSPLWV